jgi:hypothetical protein
MHFLTNGIVVSPYGLCTIYFGRFHSDRVNAQTVHVYDARRNARLLGVAMFRALINRKARLKQRTFRGTTCRTGRYRSRSARVVSRD